MRNKILLIYLFLLIILGGGTSVFANDYIDGGINKDGTAPLLTQTDTDINTYDGTVGTPTYFRIIPAVDGYYTIQSIGSVDTEGELYDSTGVSIEVQDDVVGTNFLIYRQLAKGVVYYLRVTNYSGIPKDPTTINIVADVSDGTSGLSAPPELSITNPTEDKTYRDGQTISISGTISNPDHDDVTLAATIGGKEVTTTISGGNSTWTLEWSIDATIPEGTYSNISFSAQDTVFPSVSAVYTGDIVVDKTAPTINASTDIADNNAYIDVTFSEPVRGANDGTTLIDPSDFGVNFLVNGGTVSGASISSITKTTGEAIDGSEIAVRFHLSIAGTANGLETIEIKPADDSSVYDIAGNAMESSQTGGAKTLKKITTAIIGGSTTSMKEISQSPQDIQIYNGASDPNQDYMFFKFTARTGGPCTIKLADTNSLYYVIAYDPEFLTGPDEGQQPKAGDTNNLDYTFDVVKGNIYYLCIWSNENNTVAPITISALLDNSEKAITTFNFNGLSVNGTVDETKKAITLTVPYGTNVQALIPNITHTGASISPDTGVVQNFTGPVVYTVTAADNTTQTYTATVIEADPVDINTESQVLTPIADTTVTGDESYYETSDELYGGNWYNACANYTPIKFDCSSITGTISAAQLKIFITNVDDGDTTFNLYYSSDDTWAEGIDKIISIPVSSGLLVENVSVTAADINTWKTINITDLVSLNSAIKDNDKLTLLINEGTGGSAQQFVFSSREGSNPPQLNLTVVAPDPVDITTASIAITAPVLGATPQTIAQVETATANADYTVTNVTWNEALTTGGKFKAGQTYTVTVELTSKNGKEFQVASFTPTVAGAASVGTTTTAGTGVGNKVSFLVTYAATGARVVDSIAVKTQPTDLTYTVGEALDLTGIIATLTYNDTSTEDVTLGGFAAKGITTSPANGTTMTVATHNNMPVTITCNGHNATTNNLTVTVPDPVDITAASITITAPVLGATPQTTAQVETATANADYTVTNVTWNEALTTGGKFKAGQVYTATVELASKNGKEFQAASFTPTVAGAASVGTTTTAGTGVGNKVSFLVTYAATGAKVVDSIAVKTQPTDLTYTTGEALDLTGIVATLTYNDTSTEDVALGGFAGKGITTSPENGATMAVATHNNMPVTISCNGHNATTNNLTVTVPDPVDITAASITITAPVLGATPQTKAQVEIATANADYAVTNVTWNEGLTLGGKFKAGQVYTATVELTSKNGKEFQAASFTPTVVGAASVGTTTTAGTGVGNKVSFTVTYAATGAKAVDSIAVKTQPTDLAYTTDEALDLTGIVATLTYNDTSTEDVALGGFAAKGITTSPANGTTMAVATHNNMPITISCNGHTATTNNLIVTAPDPVDITAASITITAPVLGATPQTKAQVEIATANADYAVTNVTWNEGLTLGGKFKAGQVYTATVELTSKNGKEFQAASFTPTVVGAASVGTTTTAGTGVGNKVSFTVTYAATGALAVDSIAVKTQPTDLTYTVGEALDLTGIVATLTYNDTSTEDVALGGFAAKGITASPANGTTMTVATHNNMPVTISCNGHTAATNNLAVSDAAPTVSVQDITGTLKVRETLTGHYTYSDANGDLEGISIYKWYRSDDAAGTNKVEILGATAKTYVLQISDLGKYISFEVTPVALTGTLQGTAVESTRKGAILAQVSDSSPNTSTNSSGSTKPEINTPTVEKANTEVIVNDKKVVNGTTEVKEENGKKEVIVKLDDQKIIIQLEQEKQGSTVIIPVNIASDVVSGQLNGDTLKNMENKDAVLEVKTENITYTIPAKEINIESVAKSLGSQVALKDMQIQVSIVKVPEEKKAIMENVAKSNNYSLVVAPVDFSISCTYGTTTVEVSKFNDYVERAVAIPEGVDPSKITTGVVLNPDGSFSHIPTVVEVIDGKYYAKMNSLTNSTYTVIWNPITFKDVENHWAKGDVNEVGSRLIDKGVGEGNFAPDRAITRSEFAAMLASALGLKHTSTIDKFSDVDKQNTYYNQIYAAYDYGIITGYTNGKFGPNDTITREQAMSMLGKAMEITGMNTKVSEADINASLKLLSDSSTISPYARKATAICVKNGIFGGDAKGRITPKDNFTRAQAASVIIRLLKQSDLI